MKLFISWSGDRSKRLAEILRAWLPGVIQAVRPYYSPDDLAKGARWNTEIAATLAESRLGLICVTRENIEAAWVMFEAGALSKNIGSAKVVPILFGLEPTDLTGPLVQFQAARFEESEIKRVVQMINLELGDAKLQSDVLDSVFEMWWKRLAEQVRLVLDAAVPTDSEVRTERQLLEEILTLTRGLSRRVGTGDVNPAALKDLQGGVVALVRALSTEEPTAEAAAAVGLVERPMEYFTRRHGAGGAKATSLGQEWDEALALFRMAALNAVDDDDLPF